MCLLGTIKLVSNIIFHPNIGRSFNLVQKLFITRVSKRLKKFAQHRLTDEPHYFGTAIVQSIIDDTASNKNDRFAIIGQYVAFSGRDTCKTE